MTTTTLANWVQAGIEDAEERTPWQRAPATHAEWHADPATHETPAMAAYWNGYHTRSIHRAAELLGNPTVYYQFARVEDVS